MQIGALILIGKGIAFFKDVVISSHFGTSYQTDAFFIANSIPSLIFVSFFSTVSLVFLPLYNEKFRSRGFKKASLFASNVILFYAIVSFLLSVVGVVFSSDLVRLVAPGLNEKTYNLTVQLTRILCLSFTFSVVSGILSSIQNVHKRHVGPQLIPIVNNFIVVVAIFFLTQSYGIYVVAVSSLLGWVLQVPLQSFFSRRHFKFSWKLDLADGSMKRMGMLIVPAFIGMSIDQINVLIDNILGSSLEEGNISALNYGMRLINFFSGLFVVVIANVIYPLLSDKILAKDTGELHVLLNSTMRAFFIITAPVTLLCFFYNYEIVCIVFKRGEFQDVAALLTSQVFLCYAAGIVFILFREIFNKVFYAMLDSRTPLYISVGAILINIILSIYFVEHLGVKGLALATTLSVVCYVIVQLILLIRKIGYGFLTGLIGFILKLFFAVVFMFGVLKVCGFVIYSEHFLIQLSVGSFFGGLGYLLILVLLQIREPLIALSMVRQKLRAFRDG